MSDDAAAKIIAKWLGYSWDGLQESRIGDRGDYPIWNYSEHASFSFQGGKQDLRDLAESIAAVEQDKAVAAERERCEAERAQLQMLVDDDVALTEVQEWLKAANTRAEAAEAKLARLENPDEALVEAVTGAVIEYFEADHDGTPEGCAVHTCRVLARTLEGKENSDG